MKFVKKLSLDTQRPSSNKFVVNIDDSIVTDTANNLQLPAGSVGDRPAVPNDGQIRYSTTLNEFEVYNSSGNGTGWEILRTVRPANITFQDLGEGNYANTLFGPLSYDVDPAKPQNVMVYVENVYQLPSINYNLLSTSSFSITRIVANTVTANTNTIVLTTITNVLVGQTIAASGIPVSTTVTNVNSISGEITISNTTTSIINSDSIVTLTYIDGTYVEFTGAVPTKPVYGLLGFDGYFPPFP